MEKSIITVQNRNFNNLQVLRAAAVLLVLGFHLQLPGFSAGYLGVDIFLVISGFLMFRITSADEDKNFKQLTIAFYKKRIKRLAPAYLVTTIVSTLFFFLVCLPHERIRILEQNLANVLFISNITNWAENQYFSTSLLRPTLSFWSLALEMQFYFFFPCIFLLIKKFKYFGILIFASSLLVFFSLNVLSSSSAFYLLPSRIWEFMAGVLIAQFQSRLLLNFLKRKFVFDLLLSLIILLILCVPFLEYLNYGFQNLVTVIITSLTVIASIEMHYVNFIKNFLGKIGDYSYSIYLVHLPLIVFIGYKPFAGNESLNGFKEFLECLLLITSCSLISFYLVEKRYRLSFNFKSFSSFYLLLLMISAMIFSFRLDLAKVGFTKEIVNVSYGEIDRSPFRCGTLTRIDIIHKIFRTEDSCLLTKPSKLKKFLLVGNSHADSIKTSLAKFLESKNYSLSIMRDNMALSKLNMELVEKEVSRLGIDVIVVHASKDKTDLSALRELKLSNPKLRIVVIGPVPGYFKSVPQVLLENASRHDQILPLTISDYLDENASELAFFRNADREGWLSFIDISGVMCRFTCKIVSSGGKPFYIDDNHLTLTGSGFLIKRIGNDLYRKVRQPGT